MSIFKNILIIMFLFAIIITSALPVASPAKASSAIIFVPDDNPQIQTFLDTDIIDIQSENLDIISDDLIHVFSNGIETMIFRDSQPNVYVGEKPANNMVDLNFIKATEATDSAWQTLREPSYILDDVTFVNANNGWAVGSAGTILHTTDGGNNWNFQNSGTTDDLHSVDFFDTNNGWAVGAGSTILHTSNSGTTWVKQSNPSSIWSRLTCVDFVNSNEGWVVGHGTILHTSDAGINWDLQMDDMTVILYGVSFTDSYHGWAVGYYTDGTFSRVIFGTSDGGNTWELSYAVKDGAPLISVTFIDNFNGWAAGIHGVLHTSDGGNNWVLQTANFTIMGLFFIDANNGWGVGLGGTIIQTTDGGTNWISQSSPEDVNYVGTFFTSSNKGWIVGEAMTILHTDNGGSNWVLQNKNSYLSQNLSSVDFVTSLEGWASIESRRMGKDWRILIGGILHTTDGGVTWTEQDTGEKSLDDLHFIDSERGWAVGYGGTIMHTSDGGDTWITQTSGIAQRLTGVSFVDTNIGWAVGHNGTILRTLNSGESWISQTSGTTQILYDIDFVDPNNGWAVGGNGIILRTSNGGETWTPQNTGATLWFHGVDFVDSNNGWAIGSMSILHTSDGGVTWTSQSSGVSFSLNNVDFIDSNRGWVVGDKGTIFYTGNGGNTWTSQASGSSVSFSGISGVDNMAYVVGDFGTILKSGDTPNYVDLGNPVDEALHNLIGWGGYGGWSGPTGGPPSGDETKRYQLLRGDNSVDLWVPETGVNYVLKTEVEDGNCTDNFEIYVNGNGPVYSYTGQNTGTGITEAKAHEVIVPGEYIKDNRVTVTFRNTSTDEYGLAAVYNVGLLPSSNINVGDIVKVIGVGDTGLRLRDGSPTGDILRQMPDGWTLKIIDGPQLNINGHNWWKVSDEKYEFLPMQGWVAEDYLNKVVSNDLRPTSEPEHFVANQSKIENAITWAEDQIGKTDWSDLCLKFVREAFQGEPITGWSSAEDARQQLEVRGDWFSSDSNWNPPRGALIFFSALGEYQEYGHVGIYLGNGKVIHAYGVVQTSNLAGSGGIEQLSLIGSYIGWAYPPEEWVPSDTTPPTVNNFTSDKNSIMLGETIRFSYSVADTGGSGLKQIELWEATDTNHDNQPDWPTGQTDYVDMQTLSGSVGYFDYTPNTEGTHWYGIHVLDNAGNINYESNIFTDGLPQVFKPIFFNVNIDAYHPKPYGYNFSNKGITSDLSLTTSRSIFNSAFDWTEIDSATREKYFDLWVNQNRIWSAGNCYGMSASSIMEYIYPVYDNFVENQNYDYIYDFSEPSNEGIPYLGSWSTNDPISPVLEHILRFQIMQKSYLQRITPLDDPLEIAQKISESLGSNKYILILVGEEARHAVVPYKIISRESGYRIYIYDPNHPDYDDEWPNQCWIDVKQGEFSLQQQLLPFFESQVDMTGSLLGLINIHDFYNDGKPLKPAVPASGVSYSENYLFSETASLFFTDTNGKKTGFKDGDYYNEIPGVNWMHTFAEDYCSPLISNYQPYSIDNDLDLVINVQAISSGLYSLIQMGRDYFAEVTNINNSEGSIDSYTFSSDNISLSFDKALEPRTYDLTLHKSGTKNQTFTAVNIPAIPGSSYSYCVNWDLLEQNQTGVTIKIDADGDGSFEETIITAPPYKPNSPSPEYCATGISTTNTRLSWTGGSPDENNEVYYKVYFGTTDNLKLVSDNQADSSYTLATLSYDTTYHWKIVARDNHGITTEGPLWSFTTAQQNNTDNNGGGGNLGGGGGGGAAGILGLSTIQNSEGKLLVDARAISVGAEAYLNLPVGTFCSSTYGGVISWISIQPVSGKEVAQITTDNIAIVTGVYDIEPGYALFDPPITLVFNYKTINIPNGFDEDDLFIGTWDESEKKWNKLASLVNIEDKTVSTELSHFSKYAVMLGTRPADFQLGSLSILPLQTEINETATVSIAVTNTGDISGTYEVIMNIDGEAAQTKSITLDGGDTGTASFSISLDTAGAHSVSIGNQKGILEVIIPAPPTTTTETTPVITTTTPVTPQPARFTVSELIISPELAEQAEIITISVIITNTGGREGTYNVVLMINGVEESSQSVTLGAGVDQRVAFKSSKETAGIYDVMIEGETGWFSIVKPLQPQLTEPVGGLVEESPGAEWWLIGGLLAAGVVIVSISGYLWWRRRQHI